MGKPLVRVKQFASSRAEVLIKETLSDGGVKSQEDSVYVLPSASQ